VLKRELREPYWRDRPRRIGWRPPARVAVRPEDNSSESRPLQPDGTEPAPKQAETPHL